MAAYSTLLITISELQYMLVMVSFAVYKTSIQRWHGMLHDIV